jgi:hypothetical protein
MFPKATPVRPDERFCLFPAFREKPNRGIKMGHRLAIALLALAASTPAWAATPGWNVSERSGSVTVMHQGASHIAMVDGPIAAGDIVTTGSNGRAVLVRGEEFLVVAPNSRLRVAEPTQETGLVQIFQEAGNVIFRIKRMTLKHFAVQTPYLAAVVKGTTFSVSVTPEGASVQVIEGAVEVQSRDGGASDLVRPGMIAAISARDIGRLKLDGDAHREIVSPKPQAPVATPKANTAPVKVDQIVTAIAEPTRSLSDATGGLVEGNMAAPMQVAMSTMSRQMKASSDEKTSQPAQNLAVPVTTTTTPPLVDNTATATTTGTVTPVTPTATPAVIVVSQAPVAPVDTKAPVSDPVIVVAQAPAPAPTAPVDPAVVVVAQAPAPVADPAVVVAQAPAPSPAPAVVAQTPAPVAVVAQAPVPTPAPAVVAHTPAPAIIVATNNQNGNNGNGNAFGNNNPNGKGNGNAFGNNNPNGNGNGNAFGLLKNAKLTAIIAALAR